MSVMLIRFEGFFYSWNNFDMIYTSCTGTFSFVSAVMFV